MSWAEAAGGDEVVLEGEWGGGDGEARGDGRRGKGARRLCRGEGAHCGSQVVRVHPNPNPKLSGTRNVGFCLFLINFELWFSKLEIQKLKKTDSKFSDNPNIIET